jgi:WD40 repeat protein
MLVSAGGDATLKTWDGTSGAPLVTMNASSIVYAAAITREGKLVAGGCFDGQVRLFDAKTGKVLATLVGLPGDEWLSLTPEGYLAGSAKTLESGFWRMDAATIPTPDVLKVLRQPSLVAKSLTGEAVPAPVFAK